MLKSSVSLSLLNDNLARSVLILPQGEAHVRSVSRQHLSSVHAAGLAGHSCCPRGPKHTWMAFSKLTLQRQRTGVETF